MATHSSSFSRNRWGTLKQVQFPSAFFTSKTLQISTPAVVAFCVLLVLHRREMLRLGPAKRRLLCIGTVIASRNTLMRYTGFSRRTLDKAVTELEFAGWVSMEKRRKRSPSSKGVLAGAAPNRYYLLNPDASEQRELEVRGEVNLLPTNQVRYFTAPAVWVTDYQQPWSLAKLSASETRLYLVALWLANRSRSNTIEVATSVLRSKAGIQDHRTFTSALGRLESLGLLNTESLDTTTRNSPNLALTLCDPTTGEAVPGQSLQPSSDPANYYVEGRRGSKRFVVNTGTDEDRKELLLRMLPSNAPVLWQGNGDLTIQCPYHADDGPSCSVSTSKRCFYCFGCGERGTFMALLTTLKSGDGTAVMQAIAASRGQTLNFRHPDRDALAIYSYRDEELALIKQVLRYADVDGKKNIQQRRLGGGGGWVWNAHGVGPALYHRELVREATVVCLTEGEKDADTITELKLSSQFHGPPIIGVTSGGADSWDDALAAHLKGKRVIIMPDADEPGERYGKAVAASLEGAGIPYRTVVFSMDGCKDVSEFMAEHTPEELAERIGTDWVEMPKPAGSEKEITI